MRNHLSAKLTFVAAKSLCATNDKVSATIINFCIVKLFLLRCAFAASCTNTLENAMSSSHIQPRATTNHQTNHPQNGNHSHSAPRPTNELLASLPQSEYSLLQPHLRPFDMKLGHVLHHPGEHLNHVYFVANGMFSLVLTSKQGIEVEVGMIGREGVAGASAVLTGTPTMSIIMVQIHGSALVLPGEVFRQEFKKGGVFQDKVLSHIQGISTMNAQAALCNRLHLVEQRLARWLLLVHDRVGDNYLELTQEFIAGMLGTRRAGVTEAACGLRDAGLIEYTRGSIEILDRAGLEKIACECYEIMGNQFSYAVS